MYKKWLGLLHASKFSESFGGYRKKIIVLFNLTLNLCNILYYLNFYSTFFKKGYDYVILIMKYI